MTLVLAIVFLLKGELSRDLRDRGFQRVSLKIEVLRILAEKNGFVKQKIPQLASGEGNSRTPHPRGHQKLFANRCLTCTSARTRPRNPGPSDYSDPPAAFRCELRSERNHAP